MLTNALICHDDTEVRFDHLGQQRRRPRCTIFAQRSWLPVNACQQKALNLRCDLRWPTSMHALDQPIAAFGHESMQPAPHGLITLSHDPRDLIQRSASHRQQHHLDACPKARTQRFSIQSFQTRLLAPMHLRDSQWLSHDNHHLTAYSACSVVALVPPPTRRAKPHLFLGFI
jgi:hypothetical protein